MVRIGKIAATHGTSGALILAHILETNKWLKSNAFLSVEVTKGSKIPFMVTNARERKEGEILIQLEDVSSPNDARKLVGKPVYADTAALSGFEKSSPLLWIGYQIDDQHYGRIGKIEDVMQTGAQWIAKLTYKKSEAMIPLVEATIKKLDTKAQTIYTNLPEGLLEVYE